MFYADATPDASLRSLDDMPNELVLQIVSYIDQYRSERILGHIPDDPPPSSPDTHLIDDFLKCNRALCSLALTSRRFREVAQQYLLCAPVIGGFVFRNSQQRSTSRIAFLLRMLFARPDLRRHVRQIRLCFPEGQESPGDYRFVPQMDGEHESNTRAEALDFADIVGQSKSLIMSLDLPEDLKRTWRVQIFLEFRYAMIGVLLALLPQLESLSVSEQNLRPVDCDDGTTANLIGIRRLASLYRDAGVQIDLQGIQCLPAASSLRRLKICSTFPLRFEGIDMFPYLDTLDFSMKLAGSDSLTVRRFENVFAEKPDDTANFGRIRHLRVDCQVKSVGIWDFAARTILTYLLRPFRELISLDLYAEPSHEKNPFRSVRAFPHYQANIQTYPDEPCPQDRDATQSSVWDERVYDARTEWTDYQHLVDGLDRFRPHLQSLKLPGGFWTLPGAMRKPLPSFTSFVALQRLSLPQAAILSIKLDNMRFPETKHGDFDLLPRSALPSNLQHLRIFDADAELLLSTWLQQLFDEHAQWGAWPDLQTLEVLFGHTVDDVQLADLIARRTWDRFWVLADKAPFEVLLGRDDEVPSICM